MDGSAKTHIIHLYTNPNRNHYLTPTLTNALGHGLGDARGRAEPEPLEAAFPVDGLQRLGRRLVGGAVLWCLWCGVWWCGWGRLGFFFVSSRGMGRRTPPLQRTSPDAHTKTNTSDKGATYAGFCSVMVARMMGMLMHCTKVDVTSAGRALEWVCWSVWWVGKAQRLTIFHKHGRSCQAWIQPSPPPSPLPSFLPYPPHAPVTPKCCSRSCFPCSDP